MSITPLDTSFGCGFRAPNRPSIPSQTPGHRQIEQASTKYADRAYKVGRLLPSPYRLDWHYSSAKEIGTQARVVNDINYENYIAY
jgi:hypothetical protein